MISTDCVLKHLIQTGLRAGWMWMACKGIGGIHWDEMVIKEGILLCKPTEELARLKD